MGGPRGAIDPMDGSQIRRLLRYIRPDWRLLPLVLGTMITATLLGLAPPWFMGVLLIDRVILDERLSLIPLGANIRSCGN